MGKDNLHTSDLGKRIRTLRIGLNLSQEELAKRVGYESRSTINKIEKGKNNVPTYKIMLFAKALRTTPEYLLGNDKKGDLQYEYNSSNMQNSFKSSELHKIISRYENIQWSKRELKDIENYISFMKSKRRNK